MGKEGDRGSWLGCNGHKIGCTLVVATVVGLAGLGGTGFVAGIGEAIGVSSLDPSKNKIITEISNGFSGLAAAGGLPLVGIELKRNIQAKISNRAKKS